MKYYNHGLAEKQFKRDWDKQEEEYKKAGMASAAIAQMFEFEREVFKSERRYKEHYEEAEFLWEETSDNSNEEAKKAKMLFKHVEKVSVCIPENNPENRFGWLDDIHNEKLYDKLSALKREDIELITLHFFEGYSVGEIAKIKGISHQNISKKIKRLKNVITECVM